MNTVRATVAPNGRLSIPVEIRRRLGLESGGEVVLEMEDGVLRMFTPAARVRRARALLAEGMGDERLSSEEFLAWKREEAALEAARVDRLVERSVADDVGTR